MSLSLSGIIGQSWHYNGSLDIAWNTGIYSLVSFSNGIESSIVWYPGSQVEICIWQDCTGIMVVLNCFSFCCSTWNDIVEHASISVFVLQTMWGCYVRWSQCDSKMSNTQILSFCRWVMSCVLEDSWSLNLGDAWSWSTGESSLWLVCWWLTLGQDLSVACWSGVCAVGVSTVIQTSRSWATQDTFVEYK